MPRKAAEKEVDLEEEEEEVEEIEIPTVEPYTVLGLEKTATADEVKKAYRKAALKHHPDKADASSKDAAHVKFQEVAFAYAILSDPIRRKRYDLTGSTSESLAADGDFNFAEFYSTQFRDVVTSDAIDKFAKQYKGNVEEKDDVLAAYKKGKGRWSVIYEEVLLSDPLEDEDRFRAIIDEAIAKGEVESYKSYTNETERQKDKRMENAREEGAEAEEYAKELGVHDQLFGGKGKAKGKGNAKAGGEDALKALIMQRQADRGESMLDRMEAKYGAIEKEKKAKSKKGKRKARGEEDMDEPSEEAFQAAAARLKKPKGDEAGGGRQAKKMKK